MFIESTIHPDSFLAHLCRQEPLTTTTGRELLRQIPFLRWDRSSGQKMPTTATLVAVDNGNDALKGAMLHARLPHLCTRRIVAAYAPAKQLGAGDGITTWQVNGSEPFRLGEDAFQAAKAEILPIGMTPDRLPDERYRRFLFAFLVELLLTAGYEETQGTSDLYLRFGIPNEEANAKGMNNEEANAKGMNDAVRRALTPLFHTLSTIRRTDEQGQETTWTLRRVELNPYPQTFGSFASWYYTVDGFPVETSIVKHLTLEKRKRKVFYGKTQKEVQEKINTALYEQQKGTLVIAPDELLKDFLIR